LLLLLTLQRLLQQELLLLVQRLLLLVLLLQCSLLLHTLRHSLQGTFPAAPSMLLLCCRRSFMQGPL